jgi:hypothetical protein
MRIEVVVELESLARSASEAADGLTRDREAEFGAEYTRLRGRLDVLNRRYGWAELDEFDALFPTLDEQEIIDTLERQIDTRGFPSEVEPGEPIQRLLRHLAYWAQGVALAARSARKF